MQDQAIRTTTVDTDGNETLHKCVRRAELHGAVPQAASLKRAGTFCSLHSCATKHSALRHAFQHQVQVLPEG